MLGKKGFQKGNKIGRGNRGRKRPPVSAETCLKISISSKGRKISPESIQKMKETRKKNGYRHPPEVLKKMSESRKGKKKPPFSKEHCKNISLGKLGKSNYKIKGDKCHLWKGGITSENHKVRSSLEYKIWRRAIFSRDNFTCKKCGQWGGILRAHHINNFSDFPELRLIVENGITLCKECHNEFHRIYGIKNNTNEQLIEFLKQT
jgi:endogenous inhibitor of DNA gyrase (YacG/DUF329 family)